MKILVWIVKNLRNKIKKTATFQLFRWHGKGRHSLRDETFAKIHYQEHQERDLKAPPRSLLTNVSTMSSCRKMCLAASTASLSLQDQVSASLWAKIWDCEVQVAHQLTSPPVLRIINTRGSRGTSRPKKNLMHTAVFIASECLFFYIS